MKTTVTLSMHSSIKEILQRHEEFGFKSMSTMVEAGIRKLEEGFQSPARSDKALEQFIEAKVGVFMDKQKDLYAATIRPVILTEIERRFENLIDEYIQERYPALVRRRDEELDE